MSAAPGAHASMPTSAVATKASATTTAAAAAVALPRRIGRARPATADAAAATSASGPSIRLATRRAQAAPAFSTAAAPAPGASQTKLPPPAAHTATPDLDFSTTKNVVVLGGSYGGMHCATVLAQKLPPTHRVILVDRNSHFNHLYVFPRFSVLPGHEQKAFIPYNSIFSGAPDRSAQAPTDASQSSGSSPSASTSSTSPSNEPTFDLEMGSSATTARATLASPPASSASSSASSFSHTLSSPVDDEDVRSDISASSENPTLASSSYSSSSVLFDRNSLRRGSSKGPHSARSIGSTISSLYSSRASADEHNDEDGKVLADKLGQRLTLGSSPLSEQQQQRSQSEERSRASLDSSVPRNRAHSAVGTKTDADAPEASPLHIQDEPPPAQAVHEQEVLGRKPMRIETAASSSSSSAASTRPAKEMGNIQEEAVEPSFTGAPPHVFLQGTVTDIKKDHVLVEVAPKDGSKKSLWNITSRSVQIPFTHLVYALGSHLPDPLRADARTKREGMNWMRDIQERVRDAEDIVLVGGGALGVQFASDIASVHGTERAEPHESCRDAARAAGASAPRRKKKRITLIHSRAHLLPNFDERIHEIALRRLEALGVDVVLGERLALTDGCPMGSVTTDDRVPFPRPAGGATDGSGTGGVIQPVADASTAHTPSSTAVDVRNASAAELSSAAARPGRKLVRTTKGKLFHADVLLLCTGQQPNSALLAQLSPSSVDPRTRLVKVRRTLQVERLPGTEGWGEVLEAKAPCGDCDCFMDRKVESAPEHAHAQGSACDCGATALPAPEDADAEPEDRSRCIRNVYAIGDVADAFGALNAGYQAWAMADVAAENVLRDLGVRTGCVDVAPVEVGGGGGGGGKAPPLMLRRFKPVAPMLKLSLGLGTMAWQGAAVPHRVPRGGGQGAASAPSSSQESTPTGTTTTTTTTRERSGTISSSSSAASSSAVEEEIVMRPEVMEKEDPYDLGVEGVWKFMANADTSDLYL